MRSRPAHSLPVDTSVWGVNTEDEYFLASTGIRTREVCYMISKGNSIRLGWFALSICSVVIHPERGILLSGSLAKPITPLKLSYWMISVKIWHSDSSFSMFYCGLIPPSTPLHSPSHTPPPNAGLTLTPAGKNDLIKLFHSSALTYCILL